MSRRRQKKIKSKRNKARCSKLSEGFPEAFPGKLSLLPSYSSDPAGPFLHVVSCFDAFDGEPLFGKFFVAGHAVHEGMAGSAQPGDGLE